MPTRKQKRRDAKSKRHEYEYVYVDDEGNEVETPDEPEEPRRNGTKPAVKKPQTRTGGGSRRTPQPPSWKRAARRAVVLGAVVFALFGVLAKGHNYVGAFVAAVIYTVLFIPFTFMLDRFAYNRWQQRNGQAASTKKR